MALNAVIIGLNAQNIVEYGKLCIDRSDVKNVTPVEYGFHYEEIGMMGEGALHAEMVRNRSFEEAIPPKGLAVKNGLYMDVPSPKADHKEVYHVDPLIGWTTLPLSFSPIYISLTKDNPLNEYNTYSMMVNVIDEIESESKAMIVNRGYYGMNFRKGLKYKLSLFVRNISINKPLSAFLIDEDGRRISEKCIMKINGKGWQKQTAVLCADKDVQRGMLAIQPQGEGKFQLDVVSMFPDNTWDSGKSVFRADIMNNLKEYAPDFIRFPGGCIVHGVNEETMYHWKQTIGPIENRAGEWSKWTPHYRTDGIGYHEFYQLCEYLGADAMYVASTGMVCTEWLFKRAPWNFIQPKVNIDYYINDALDAIEYAIGDVTTKWGAERARNGHPSPFPLKYVEIGNEDFGSVYWESYEKMYNALHSKYPQLIYITNSTIGKENDDKRGDIKKFPDPKHVKVFDEHYYKTAEWACLEHYKFDKYKRGEANLFIGELGLSGKYPVDILATGVVRMAMERNGDLNPMLAERPLMRNWDMMEHGFPKAMLINGIDSSVKTALYYVSKLFKDNKIDKYIASSVQNYNGVQKVFVTMGYDSHQNEYVLKIINLTGKTVLLNTEVKGFNECINARKCLLQIKEKVNNTPINPDVLSPVTTFIKFDLQKAIRG
jgi:alpha-N-arabinofuranosidase